MRMITPTLVTLAVVLTAQEGQAGGHHASKMNRYWGVGWSAGYHVHQMPTPVCSGVEFHHGVTIEPPAEILPVPAEPHPRHSALPRRGVIIPQNFGSSVAHRSFSKTSQGLIVPNRPDIILPTR